MDRNDLARWASIRPGYWFAPKLFGWGATPVTWQGWAATIGFVAGMLAIQTLPGTLSRLVLSILLIAGFLLLARIKTDGVWKWRWGKVD